jgi:hypothetical protein
MATAVILQRSILGIKEVTIEIAEGVFQIKVFSQ